MANPYGRRPPASRPVSFDSFVLPRSSAFEHVLRRPSDRTSSGQSDHHSCRRAYYRLVEKLLQNDLAVSNLVEDDLIDLLSAEACDIGIDSPGE